MRQIVTHVALVSVGVLVFLVGLGSRRLACFSRAARDGRQQRARPALQGRREVARCLENPAPRSGGVHAGDLG